MGNRIVKLSLLVAALAAAGVVFVSGALASTEVVGDFGISGVGRTWDFDNGPFQVGDGAISLPGHSANDGYDSGLILVVDGTSFTDGDGSGTYTASSNSFRVGPDLTGGLVVTRTERASGPYLRSLITLHNATATAYNGTISWNSNLGSDDSEVTQSSSSGDKHYTKGDRWVVSSESGNNGWDDDPTDAFALYGKGAKERVDTVQDGPGDGAVNVDFEDLKVPANGTRYLLFYSELHANPTQAKKSMHKYDSHKLSRGLLKGIGKSTRKSILNWDL